MITTFDLREQLVERPFQPFRIHLSDGQNLEIRHPDMCIVTRHVAHVGIPDPKAKGLAVSVSKCAIMHITRIEPLNGSRQKGSQNGKKRRR